MKNKKVLTLKMCITKNIHFMIVTCRHPRSSVTGNPEPFSDSPRPFIQQGDVGSDDFVLDD